MNLTSLLHQTFGFASFRANQEAVCRAATDGRDVLLVMPTGAGKSLCYQLPAIARGGTALVISPLIALMDDQASKLSHLGIRTARIHSGLSRDEARQACRDYLDGTLQFLFIAPERMRVPNFPEMLAKKKPSLIAIDEAHCISAWGHDFRPDYRTLGDFLPALRPAPVIALTATATPTVQKDIVTQLQLSQPALFIHGFRRHNLAIEVVELSKPRRNEFTAQLLKDKSNRPAIVYAPSRKAAEELAAILGGSAAAYHAGLDPGTRERVQREFLTGKLEVVVATIAFGMGIDKADVRTVVHTGLPGSVEQFYQEIGRAGRDGLPSRTVLLHSFADRKMHDFFLERDYPAITELTSVAALLTDDYQMPDLLRQRLKMDAETFDKAVEKLIAQGAASIDMAGNVRRSHSNLSSPASVNAWKSGYDQQIAFRRSQIDRMVQFTESAQCRMAALIQHFGDTDDGLRPCGHCDFCAPGSATAQTFRPPTTEEDRQLRAILRALDGQSRSTGKLHTELSTGPLRNTPAADRKGFDLLLDALTRAALITLITDTFTNSEGVVINYKKAALTHEGRTFTGPLPPDLLVRDVDPSQPRSRNRIKSIAARVPNAESNLSASRRSSDKTSPTSTVRTPEERIAHRAAENKRVADRAELRAAYTQDQKSLDTQLRLWRKEEAAGNGRPAFFVLTDTALYNIVIANPQNLSELRNIQGVGRAKADNFGAAIIAICTVSPEDRNSGAGPSTGPTPKVGKLASVTDDERRHAKEARYEERIEQRASYSPEDVNLDTNLRAWRKAEAVKKGMASFVILADAALHQIVLTRPQTMQQLSHISGIGQKKAEKYGAALLAVLNGTYVPEPVQKAHPVDASNGDVPREPETFQRQRAAVTDPSDSLTPDQQSLDQRLRDWRKSESEKLGLPLFFVLASTTLRSIVLARPQTLSQLKAVHGLGHEKAEKFGPGILEVCTA